MRIESITISGEKANVRIDRDDHRGLLWVTYICEGEEVQKISIALTDDLLMQHEAATIFLSMHGYRGGSEVHDIYSMMAQMTN